MIRSPAAENAVAVTLGIAGGPVVLGWIGLNDKGTEAQYVWDRRQADIPGLGTAAWGSGQPGCGAGLD